MKKESSSFPPPSIMAPAGNRASFLAAIAAGADVVYCGLKHFSARMEAKNFTVEELIILTRLAHRKGTKVYVALNSLIKSGDLDQAGEILQQLSLRVKPDAIIVHDLSLVQLARQTGFAGELHLSTLANVSFFSALSLVKEDLGVDRVVLPRELSVDEIKAMAAACPPGLSLEVFVHGALCYGVSGRCYWSSYLGGRSGLRGRCVQPCRRLYGQSQKKMRFFSCQDLSLDVLVKVLLSVPQVRAWKIEGRKKGPHYVYYTVKAYQILRDQGTDPQMKREALGLLALALGRPGTHYGFLSQRPQNPVRTDIQTGSGLLMGRIKGSRQRPYINARDEILPGDVLRLGYEDESWHHVYRIKGFVPRKGRLDLRVPSGRSPQKGTPVFLVDRRERELDDQLSRLEGELPKTSGSKKGPSTFHARLPKRSSKRRELVELNVHRRMSARSTQRGPIGLWLSGAALKAMPEGCGARLWWWLPPVVWPEDEDGLKKLVGRALKAGGRSFVLNAPWQVALFKTPRASDLWAGPFCNLANPLAINAVASSGFAGAIVSPELGRDDYFFLPQHSPIPLGIVISGNWPLSIARTVCRDLKTDRPFNSPKGEKAWVIEYGPDFWVYPDWRLDLSGKKNALQRAGYSLFVNLVEPLPRGVKMKKRPGLWNWDLNLV